MTTIYLVAAFWFLSALISTIIANRLKISNALMEITISALYGLTNNIINTEQYSIIVGVVIASAVVPTLIANKFFLPEHLLEKPVLDDQLPDIIKAKR